MAIWQYTYLLRSLLNWWLLLEDSSLKIVESLLGILGLPSGTGEASVFESYVFVACAILSLSLLSGPLYLDEIWTSPFFLLARLACLASFHFFYFSTSANALALSKALATIEWACSSSDIILKLRKVVYGSRSWSISCNAVKYAYLLFKGFVPNDESIWSSSCRFASASWSFFLRCKLRNWT